MKRIVLFLTALSLGSATLLAQGVRSTRLIKTTALNVYESYIEAMNGLADQSSVAKDRFLSLFDGDNDTIFNDILPDNTPEMLNAQSYVNKYNQCVRRAHYQYSNFRMGKPFSLNGNWDVVCTFDRTVQYEERSGIIFPMQTFSYSMHIVMDKKSSSKEQFDRPRIKSITFNEKFHNYVIIHNPSGSINMNGRIQNNNAKDYWIGDLGNASLSSLNTDPLNPLTVKKYKKMAGHRNRYEQVSSNLDVAGLGVGFSPYGVGNRLDGRFEGVDASNMAFRLHGFWGKNLVSDDNGSLFFNVGLSLFDKMYSISGRNTLSYSATDKDGDDYVRNISLDIIKDRVSSVGVSLPVTFSYLLAINDPARSPLFLSLEAGVVPSFKFLTMHSFDVQARYTGRYNYFGGVVFDHYYDYGDFTLNRDKVESDVKENVNKFDLAASLALGVWMGFGESAFLRFDISMMKGFLSELKYDDNYRISERYDDYHSPLRSSDKGAFDIYLGISYVVTLKNK